MPKQTIRLATALLTFLLGIVAVTTVFLFKGKDMPRQSAANTPAQDLHEVRQTNHDTRRELIFFRSINQLTKEAKLPSLRTVMLPDDDFEVRVWSIGGENGELYGVILRRSAGQWSAIHIYGKGEDTHLQKYQETLAASKSGWETAWERLVNAGILRLPNASELQCNSPALDGAGYVVEINMKKNYRTYMYENPAFAGCNEAKQMIKIAEIVDEEFGWKYSRIKD